jgi:hypothetical protein
MPYNRVLLVVKLSNIPGQREQTYQVVDISIPRRVLINHTLTKYCSCGHCNKASFPAGAKGPVNYGNVLRGLIANLSVRQYMPYKPTVEFIEDIFGIPISQGSITNLLAQFKCSAVVEYNNIYGKICRKSR